MSLLLPADNGCRWPPPPIPGVSAIRAERDRQPAKARVSMTRTARSRDNSAGSTGRCGQHHSRNPRLQRVCTGAPFNLEIRIGIIMGAMAIDGIQVRFIADLE